MAHNDDQGKTINVGDSVIATYLNADRGAFLYATGTPGRVVGFGRTRVRVQFGHRNRVDTIGAECLRVVA